MPIRFRCASCDKMLSIARRKTGAVVNCPTCRAELIVPTEVRATVHTDGNGTAPPPAPKAPPPKAKKKKRPAADGPSSIANATPEFGPPPNSMPLFERPDFEALLSPNSGSPSQPIVASQPELKPQPVQARPVAPMPIPIPSTPDEPDVVLVSRGNLTLVAVVMIVLVGLAFAAGYIIAAVTLKADGAA